MIHRVDHSGQAQNGHISCSKMPRDGSKKDGFLENVHGRQVFFLGAFDLVKRYFEEQHRL
jgi:hypothetical protein